MEEFMTIQDFHTTVHFSIPSEWTSLITSKKNDDTPLSLKKIFKIYTQSVSSLDAPRLTVKKEKLRQFRVLFRNLYMEALISGNEEKTIEVCHALTLFGEDYTKLFEDIHQLFKDGYNPTWRIGLIHLQLLLKKKPWITRFAKNLLRLSYDGSNSLLDIDKDQLLAYRVVNCIKKLNCIQEGSLCELAIEKFQKLEKKKLFNHDIDCTFFETTYYYLVVLSNHQKLRDSITGLIQLFYRYDTPQEKPNFSADDLIETLLTGENDACRKVIDMLKHIKRSIDFSFFKIDLDQLEKMNLTGVRLENISLGSVSDIKHRNLEKQLLTLSIKAPLPHIYRKAILPKLITQTNDKYSNHPEKALNKLHTLTQWLYQSTESAQSFKSESIPLALKIYELTKLQFKKNDKTTLQNSWELLCHGKLNPKQLEKVLDDLNMECVRLIRQVMLKDINPKLEAYDEIAKHTLTPARTSSSHQLVKKIYTPVKKSNSLDTQSNRSMITVGERVRNRTSSLKSSLAGSSKGSYLLDKDYNSDTASQTSTKESPRSELSDSSDTSPRSDNEIDIEVIPKKSIGISDFFNSIINLTAYYILTAKNDKSAAEIIKNSLLFAKMAVESQQPNLTVAWAIIAALQTNAITRLKTPFSLLGGKYHTINRELSELFSPTENYRKYRDFCNNSPTPVVPFLGVHQKEFTYLTESDGEEQNLVKSNLCDSFYKMQHVLKISYLIKPCQTDCIANISNPSILSQMQKPPRKIDVEIDEEFLENEWELLKTSEQLYYFSRYNWR
jgi:RasGEF domain